MIKKIYTTSLKPGMFVVETGLSKSENPHIYSEEGEIVNTDQIQQIISEGFLEVFVDANKGGYFKINPDEKSEIVKEYEKLSDKEDKSQPDKRSLSLMRLRIEEAEYIYNNSLDYVKNVVDSLKNKRKIDFEKSEEYIGHVFSHISNNVDSLLFVSKLKQHDKYTYTHNLNVSIFSLAFASTLGLGTENIKILGLSGLFHDIGKVMIDQDILNKPGKLNSQEFEEIKKHPTHGYNILQNDKKSLATVCRAAYEHHEKYSGGGYPQNLNSSQICIQASLISVIDIFDALTSDRVYKKRIDLHKALGIVFNLKGSSLNPALVDKFIKFLGIYPVGSIVSLNNGKKAIVIEQNNSNLLSPKVRIVMDENNHYCNVVDFDLLNQNIDDTEKLEIVESLSPEKCRINISNFLF
jgi:HD-GYP domain-containing protein (c-di-GMP phosphodiesterase class II)